MSFADEAGFSERGSTTDSGENQERQSLSNLIDGGYHENDPDNERRESNGARTRQHMSALVHAARELLFAGTRPDGLRPITGAPMGNGVSLREGGSIFVGMAGLRGFDLSFLETQNDTSGTGNVSAIVPQSEVDMITATSGADQPTAAESSETLVAHEPIPIGQAQLEQASLLDRAPGSLAPDTSVRIESPAASSVDGGTEIRPDDGDSSPRTSVPLTPPFVRVMNHRLPERGGRSSTARYARNGIIPAESTKVHTSDASAKRGFSPPKPALLWSASTLDVEDLVESVNTLVCYLAI